MMIFILPQLIITSVVVVIVRYALPAIFKLCGWPRGATLVLEDTLGAILFLLCAAVMAMLAFWYPIYVGAHHELVDGPGFILFYSFPFDLLAAVIAGIAFFRLLMAVVRRPRKVINAAYLFCGGLLALIGLSPLLCFAWKMLWLVK